MPADETAAMRLHATAEVREVALRNFRQMRKSTSEMIASFRETYRVMLESDALQAKRVEKEGK